MSSAAYEDWAASLNDRNDTVARRIRTAIIEIRRVAESDLEPSAKTPIIDMWERERQDALEDQRLLVEEIRQLTGDQ